jgi:hypothetical protein
MNGPRKDDRRGANYARSVREGDRAVPLVELRFALTLGLRIRRRIPRALACVPHVTILDDDARLKIQLEHVGTESARHSASDVNRLLSTLACERLTPKAVEEALGITTKERVRWTKDGRLPKSGTGTFKKGSHVFQYSLHPADKIAELAKNPSVVASWRRNDEPSDAKN